MFKRLVFLAMVLFVSQAVSAEEKGLFHCTSEVEGFTAFTIFQVSESTEITTASQVALRADLLATEIWNQYGNAKLWAGTQIFESQFEKINLVPGLPADRIYVSINDNGIGALSANSGLDPITCQKLY